MNAEEAQRKFKEADSLYNAGDYAEALALLEELRAAFPGEKNVLYAYILCLQALGQRDDALVAVGQLQALGDPRANDLLKGLSPAQRPSHSSPKPRSRGTRLAFIAGGIAIVGIALCAFVLISLKHNASLAHPDMGQSSIPASPSRKASVPPANERANAEPKTIPPEKDDPHPRIVFPAPPYPGEFNLEREVARVMLDPRVPDVNNPNWEHYKKWNRQYYQDIIDAAREKRLSHGNPYNGEKVQLPDTDEITVPGNITGKDTLRIRYLCNSNPPRPPNRPVQVWGDQEDIVYIHGTTSLRSLTILPGTIILFAAFQNDCTKSAMTPEMIGQLAKMYDEGVLQKPPGHKFDSQLFRWLVFHENEEYAARLSFLAVAGEGSVIRAVGTLDRPIVVVSDAKDPSPYDFSSINIETGVMDCLFTENHTGMSTSQFAQMRPDGPIATSSSKGLTLTARCKFNDHLADGRNGAGYVIGCFFGDAGYNESLEMAYREHEHHILYNVFSNGRSGCIGIVYAKALRVEHNRFVNCTDIAMNLHRSVDDIPTANVSIKHNDISPGYNSKTAIVDNTKRADDLRENYWGTTDLAAIRRLIWANPPNLPDQPTVDLSNPLPYPDSDLDGLTDDDERKLGTDPNKMDTDGDGLIDGLEVNEYHTDPLNWDTDGDGIPDGLEVYIGTDAKDKASFVPIGSSGDYFYDHVQLK